MLNKHFSGYLRNYLYRNQFCFDCCCCCCCCCVTAAGGGWWSLPPDPPPTLDPINNISNPFFCLEGDNISSGLIQPEFEHLKDGWIWYKGMWWGRVIMIYIALSTLIFLNIRPPPLSIASPSRISRQEF